MTDDSSGPRKLQNGTPDEISGFSGGSCRFCGGELPVARLRRHAVTCSRQCSRQDAKRKYRDLNPRVEMSSGTRGAISELVVAVDLLNRGYAVFRALSPSCPCDLAILVGAQLFRVEVRTGTRLPSGKVCYAFGSKDRGRHDILAVVTRDNEISYFPGLPEKLGESRKSDSTGG